MIVECLLQFVQSVIGPWSESVPFATVVQLLASRALDDIMHVPNMPPSLSEPVLPKTCKAFVTPLHAMYWLRVGQKARENTSKLQGEMKVKQ